MPCRPCGRSVSSVSSFFTTNKKAAKQVAVVAVALATLTCVAQNQPQTSQEQGSQPSQTHAQPQAQKQAKTNETTVTIAAGTRLALVLTQPIQTRYIHRGDDIYAQTVSPVTSGNEVVIPAGTFVQGKMDKLERRGGRGELRLQSMAITFPDGYVAPIPGPVTLESNEGYMLKDPGNGRFLGAFALPMAGVGLGALIGHSVGAQPSTITSSIPTGCTGPPPGCISSSSSAPGSTAKNTIIGAGIGGAIGGIASLALLLSSRHFFLDVGTPVEMTLQRSVSLEQGEVDNAMKQSEQQPVAEQPVAPRPLPPPPPDTPGDHGICYTPGMPGTPPTIIPGIPGLDGIPGPPTIIPGTPPTPGTPYPCP